MRGTFLAAGSTAVLLFAGPALAQGPGGTGQPSVTISARMKAARELAMLITADGVTAGAAPGAAHSMVGFVTNYQDEMKAAQALHRRNQRNSAIAEARDDLALNIEINLTPRIVRRLDATLGIKGVSPDLGTTRD